MPVMPPELQGDVEIQQLMLTSHTRWHTLHIIYTVNQYPSPGSNMAAEQQNVQVWIQLPAEFKVVISAPKGEPQTSAISDGKNIIDSSGQQQSVPPSVLEPFNPPNTTSDTVYPHPLAGYLGTPVSELIFPEGLAQRGGEYKQTGQELVAERQAYVVEWSREPGKLIDRFWVDVQTGIILRQQNYGKENNASPLSDFQATYIEINTPLPADTFNLAAAPTPLPGPQPPAPGTAWVTVKPEVGILNVRSQPDTIYKIISTLKSGERAEVLGKNAAGDWWQVNVNGTVGWVFAAMVDFSGDPAAVPVIPQ
jgi:outer membrane lipoprotein-sorting protein